MLRALTVSLQSINEQATLCQTNKMSSESSHVLYKEYKLLPSRRSRFKVSFSRDFLTFSCINSSLVRTSSLHRDQTLVLMKQNKISKFLVEFKGKVGKGYV